VLLQTKDEVNCAIESAGSFGTPLGTNLCSAYDITLIKY